jgi:PII-like signaling protein
MQLERGRTNFLVYKSQVGYYLKGEQNSKQISKQQSERLKVVVEVIKRQNNEFTGKLHTDCFCISEN